MKAVTSLIISLICISSWASSNAINIPPGKKHFSITLPSNPTTGFQWKLVNSNPQLVQLSGSRFFPGDKKRMGAPGNTQFLFSVKPLDIPPIETRLLFQYVRPWEKTPGKQIEVQVRFTHDVES